MRVNVNGSRSIYATTPWKIARCVSTLRASWLDLPVRGVLEPIERFVSYGFLICLWRCCILIRNS
ncbi:MAG: hypothetical protein VB140_02515 [Burkholderia sp.]